MIKSIFELSKNGLTTAIFGDNSIPEYQFEDKYLTKENGAFEFDQFTLNVYYSQLSNEIINEISEFDDFESFCPKFVQKEYLRFAKLHQSQKKRDVQGAGEIIYRVQEYIKDLTGLFAVTTQTSQGFSAKITALKMMLDYFKEQGQEKQKVVYLGKNIASEENFAGLKIESVVVGKDLQTTIQALESAVDQTTACVIVTDLFFGGFTTEWIGKVSQIAHKNNAFVYGESANFAKALSVVRPSDLGVDIFEFNAENLLNIPTLNGFSPLAVCEKLEKYLPEPYAQKDKSGTYTLFLSDKNNWQTARFIGSLNSCVKLYAYLSVLGSDGLRNYAETKLLNSEYFNYLAKTNDCENLSECEDFCDIEAFVIDEEE